ncbi:hypothetical protein WA026_017578 [Henosepilachna vigintioctopunctata]|uniref:Uncharacterized protein n=1 Tax=Henosepilachna vigintioctopunctata TaxID=420089 RepID=A0AAW1UUZ0_9CUCU
MRWFSLKGLLVLLSVWHVSHQLKDLLESIHPNVENSFELNSFLQDVMKMKKAFKEIRDAAADLSEDEDNLTEDHMNDDIDEYIYDAENLEANRRKLNGGKHHENSNQLSHYHQGNRPSNDIYPHIYKEHADLDHEKSIRFRRQLIEDVQVEPKSSKGNIRVQGDKLNTADQSFKSESTPNDARETLLAIFSEFLKSTLPYQDDVSGTTENTPEKTENFETTPNGPENIILITNSRQEEVPQSKSVGNSEKSHLQEKKKNYNIQIMEDGKIVRDYAAKENRQEHSSENDLSTASTKPYDIRSSSGLQNGFSPKIENDKYDRTYDDGTKTSVENIERVASIIIPLTESQTLRPTKVKEHAPMLMERKLDGTKNFYRLRSPENVRPHPYNDLEYLQQMYPRYSYIPNQNIYDEEYQSPYNVKYRPQIHTFKIEDNRRDLADYPVNNEFYQLRRLKSTNESLKKVQDKNEVSKNF